MWVIEMGEEPCLAADPPALSLRACVLGVKDLHRDPPLQEDVAACVDDGRPAAAGDLVEAVAADEHAAPQVQAAEYPASRGPRRLTCARCHGFPKPVPKRCGRRFGSFWVEVG